MFARQFRVVNLNQLKPISHFNRIVAKRTVFYCVHIIAKRSVFYCFVNTQAEQMIWTKQNTLRFATIEVENGL